MMFFVRQTDEYGAEHRKHIGLHECDQEFQGIHEEQHDDAEEVQAQTKAHAHAPSEEDDAGKTEDDGVTCHHVGKKTNHERKWLGKYTEKLYYRHDRSRVGFQEQGHLWPKNLFPIFFIGEDVNG